MFLEGLGRWMGATILFRKNLALRHFSVDVGCSLFSSFNEIKRRILALHAKDINCKMMHVEKKKPYKMNCFLT